MHWAMWDAMFKAQTAFEGVISNFPNRLIGAMHAPDRVSARPAVCRALRRARARGREAPARAVRDARPPDRGDVRSRRRTTTRSRRSSARSQPRSRPSRSRRRFARPRRKAASIRSCRPARARRAGRARGGRGRDRRRRSARWSSPRATSPRRSSASTILRRISVSPRCMLMPPSVAPAPRAVMHKAAA